MRQNRPAVELNAVFVSLKNGERRRASVHVATEAPVSIYVNRERLVTIYATPLMLRELALGHLLGEGIIKNVEEVETVSARKSSIYITTSKAVESRIATYRHPLTITSECASIQDFRTLLDRMDAPKVTSDCRVRIREILVFAKMLGAASSRSKLGAALHSTGIFQGEKMVAFAEDVSRHGSTDKAIGAAASDKVDFTSSVLLSTGRQAASMVLKTARVGIPISISIRGPIESGVYAANRVGVTLACFGKGGELMVFSNPRRIVT